MQEIHELVAKYASSFQQCLLSADPIKHISNLPDGFIKKLLQILLSDYSPDHPEIFRTNFQLDPSLIPKIVQWKTHAKILTAKHPSQIADIIKKFIKDHQHHFDYPRPADLYPTQPESDKRVEQKKNRSILPPIQSLREWASNKIQQNESQIQNFSIDAIMAVRQDLIVGLSFEKKKKLFLRLNEFNTYFSDQFIIERVKQLVRNEDHTIESEDIGKIIGSMTKSQLNKLHKQLPQLTNYKIYFQKLFQFKLDSELCHDDKIQLTMSEKDERRKALNNILSQVNAMNTTHLRKLQNELIAQILWLDLQRDDVNLSIFTKYLETCEIEFCELFNEQIKNRREGQFRSSHLYPKINLKSTIQLSQKQMMEQYMTKLFCGAQKNEAKSVMLKYLKEQMVEHMFAVVSLYNGGRADEVKEILSNEELGKIRERQELTIIRQNKRCFRVEDEVLVKVEIKNLEKFKIKIYELDLQKHYLYNKGKIDQLQDVSYMVPNQETDHLIQIDNPYRKQIYDVKIHGIPQQRGKWIVELESQTISSRAFIHKGSISAIPNHNSAGVQLTFYSETGQQIRDLLVWRNNKKQNVDQYFTIPYGEYSTTCKIIAVKQRFAQEIEIDVPAQRYDLKVGYMYGNESFLVGSMGKIILHPRLTLSEDTSLHISYKLLENVTVSVSLTSDKGIKTVKTYENVQLKVAQDYLLEFPIQSYLSQICVQVNCSIHRYNGTIQQLNSLHNIQIDLGTRSNNYLDFYITVTDQGYTMQVLGINGEQIPNCEVNLTYSVIGRSDVHSVNIVTDAQAKILLGHLQGVKHLTARASLKGSEIYKIWQFNNQQTQICWQPRMVFPYGKDIILPALNNQKVILYKIIGGSKSKTDNYSHHCCIKDSMLHIRDLKMGTYLLSGLVSKLSVEIEVVKGQIWGNNLIFDADQNNVTKLYDYGDRNVCLGEAHIEEQDDLTLVTIPIISAGPINPATRYHVMAYQFLPTLYQNRLKPMQFNIGKPNVKQQLGWRVSKYYNNKVLSEQASYVMKRKRSPQYLGNNLQKPHILLKGIQVNKTNKQDEYLAGQQNYRSADDLLFGCRALRKGNFQRQSQLRCHHSMPIRNTISFHNNFLSFPAITISNQNATQLVQFKIPKNYCFAQVFLISPHNFIQKSYHIPTSKPVAKKDMRHIGLVQKNKQCCWSMCREIYNVKKGQCISVGRNSLWSVVDLSVIAEYARIQNMTVDDWVLHWETYSEQKKLKVYDQSICHQLNAFIRYKDPEFFNRYVRKFLSNKLVKTVVDHCLLGQTAAYSYMSISNFIKLNAFEQILLIKFLLQKDNKSDAFSIVQSMVHLSKSNKVNSETFNNHFDGVLNSRKPQNLQPIQVSQSKPFQVQQSKPFQVSQSEPFQVSQSEPLLEQQCPVQQKYQILFEDNNGLESIENERYELEQRKRFKKDFKQPENTKQYIETTYSGMKNPHQSTFLVQVSEFWASLAQAIYQNQPFNPSAFMHLSNKSQFTIALIFIPLTIQAAYQIANKAEQIVIQAKNQFLIFVKELKQQKYAPKTGVLMNQRFFDPSDRDYYEQEGTQIEKEVKQFVPKKPYGIKTLITNTTGSQLGLQLLVDIPYGSIPLLSLEPTQIDTIKIRPYTTLCIEKQFYFPTEGQYTIYPANVSKQRQVISKVDKTISSIKVHHDNKNMGKLQSFEDIVKSGKNDLILDYLKSKNIFDVNIFEPSSILWMLKDKTLFEQVIKIFTERRYLRLQYLIFGYYHNDLQVIKEYHKCSNQFNSQLTQLPIFEYFPYYSPRVHRFLDQNKSTIRNTQFRKTYNSFLFASLLNQPTSPQSRLTLTYYLILQDRLDQACTLLSHISETDRKDHQLQFDYIEAYIDMCKGFPSFRVARKTCMQYKNYPIQTWQKMFDQINKCLSQYDEDFTLEEQQQMHFTTNIINEGHQLRISVPPESEVYLEVFNIHLEMYFSSFPFQQLNSLVSPTFPNHTIKCNPIQGRQSIIKRDDNWKDCFIQVHQRNGGQTKKVNSFMWRNPKLKAKVQQSKGLIQIYYGGKKLPGCYIKVYHKQGQKIKFYRDGYTDITGTFKYALDGVTKQSDFSILAMSQYGGLIQYAGPPSQQGYLS